MKTTLLLIVGIVSCFFSQAQFNVNITADANTIPSSDYQMLDAIMGGTGPICSYKIYAEFPDGFYLSAIYGTSTEGAVFNVASGNTFYQNPAGAAAGFDVDLTTAFPLLQYDSWLTIGSSDASTGDDYPGALMLETFPFFENFELGYDVAVDPNSIGLSEAGLFVFNSFAGDGSPIPAYNVPDANGRVLIGQLTARQFISGCLTFSLNGYGINEDVQVNTQACFSFSPSFLDADFNQDGYVDMIDLGIIMSDFGCVGGCNADLNGDNMVTIEDLQSFVYYYSVYGDDVN